MLLLKRLFTAAVLFVVIFIVVFILTSAIVGGIAGARATNAATAHDFQSGYDVGHEAGGEAGRKYGTVRLLGAAGVAAVTSLALSFSGTFPWCRRDVAPPLPLA